MSIVDPYKRDEIPREMDITIAIYYPEDDVSLWVKTQTHNLMFQLIRTEETKDIR